MQHYLRDLAVPCASSTGAPCGKCNVDCADLVVQAGTDADALHFIGSYIAHCIDISKGKEHGTVTVSCDKARFEYVYEKGTPTYGSIANELMIRASEMFTDWILFYPDRNTERNRKGLAAIRLRRVSRRGGNRQWFPHTFRELLRSELDVTDEMLPPGLVEAVGKGD